VGQVSTFQPPLASEAAGIRFHFHIEQRGRARVLPQQPPHPRGDRQRLCFFLRQQV